MLERPGRMFAISKTLFYTDSTKDNCESKLQEAGEKKGKKGRQRKKKEKQRNSEFDEPFSVSAQRNHSRTKVSRFKSGRATSSLSREFTAKTARARICTMRAYIVWTFVIMHATFVNIFSASVGSHSMTQTRCITPRILTSMGKLSIMEGTWGIISFFRWLEIKRYSKRYFKIF